MANIICVNCMKGTLDVNGVCSACKKTEADLEISRRHLTPRTILKGKYLVGKVIGEGGFGITYIGYDLDLEIRVAIKEFCPRDFAARDITDGLTILPFDRESAEFFQAEKEKFINEAKRLGKFRGEQGIVSVQDYFQENGTAYIVMEYIDGITLKSFQSMIGTSMEVEKVLNLMKPVMEGLAKLHENGVIHRDISPDNIMIDTAKEKIYLIDFGTAREVRFQEERSLSVYKKGGYTPIEQQTSHGKQGPWTDVYALCATIYRCITGKSIPEVNNRLVGDALIKPSDMGFTIDARTETALLRGLAIKPEERTQNMEQLMKELYEADSKPQPVRNEYKTAIVKKAPVTEELTVTKQEEVDTVPITDVYAAKRSFEQKNNTSQTQNNNISKVASGIFVFVIILVIVFVPIILLEKMSDPSRNNYEVEQENGLTKYVEYQAENDYTITWKDEYGNVVETKEFKNGEPVSGVYYDDEGNVGYYDYETEDDYTVTWVDEYGETFLIREYRNGQRISAILYHDDGGTEYFDYETEDNYTIIWKDLWGELKGTKEYRNGHPISEILYEDDGDTRYYDYETEDDFTITWKNSAGKIIETREYRNNEPVEGMWYLDDGNYAMVDYSTEDDYEVYYYNTDDHCYAYRKYVNGEMVVREVY